MDDRVKLLAAIIKYSASAGDYDWDDVANISNCNTARAAVERWKDLRAKERLLFGITVSKNIKITKKDPNKTAKGKKGQESDSDGEGDFDVGHLSLAEKPKKKQAAGKKLNTTPPKESSDEEEGEDEQAQFSDDQFET